jgi:hypothetical protein
MASKRLMGAVRSVALCDQVKSWDFSDSREQFHLPPEEEISEDGNLRDWGCADERALRLEIFQFLRNLEARSGQRRIFH